MTGLPLAVVHGTRLQCEENVQIIFSCEDLQRFTNYARNYPYYIDSSRSIQKDGTIDRCLTSHYIMLAGRLAIKLAIDKST